jgi:hypothetical protein
MNENVLKRTYGMIAPMKARILLKNTIQSRTNGLQILHQCRQKEVE